MEKQKIIVQKFGGTSVVTPKRRQLIVNHIKRTLDEGFQVVAVVSAIGRRGDPYATDTLLDLLKTEGEPINERNYDFIFQTGEIISAALMSHKLNLQGIPSVALTGSQAGIQTNGYYRKAEITKINTKRLLYHIDKGEVPIVTGGQGISKKGEVNILGRGGSDTSGVALGVALKAEKIEIYKDVQGVAVTDPRIVPETPFLKTISYDKLYLMGLYGAKVLHPKAVLTGKKGGIPIICRSTLDMSPGTLISENENLNHPLVGLTKVGPVDLFVLEERSIEEDYIKMLYDRLGVLAMIDKVDGSLILAVLPNWASELKTILSTNNIKPQKILHNKSLVSLIGSSGFIDHSFPQVKHLLKENKISFFSEKTDSRSTFAVPNEESIQMISKLHNMFISNK